MPIKVLGMETLIGVELHNKTLFSGVCLAKIGDNQQNSASKFVLLFHHYLVIVTLNSRKQDWECKIKQVSKR